VRKKSDAKRTPESNTISLKKKSQFGDIVARFFRNKVAVLGFVIICILSLCALFPDAVAPYDPVKQYLSDRFVAPCAEHLFGTDEFGRDVFSRVVFGCRTSLLIGLASVAISCLLGVAVGCVSGYYGGIVDDLIMRVIDIMMAIPVTLLGISIVAALGQSIFNLILAIAIGSLCPYARLVRVSVLSIKDQEFVEAARATGASNLRIILKYILPNCMAPIIVQASMSIAFAIMVATGLSFLGLGVPPPTPEWGSMASSARSYIRDYWWLVTFPGLAIMASVFSFNLFGDGLRDALDPKLKN